MVFVEPGQHESVDSFDVWTDMLEVQALRLSQAEVIDDAPALLFDPDTLNPIAKTLKVADYVLPDPTIRKWAKICTRIRERIREDGVDGGDMELTTFEEMPAVLHKEF